MTDTTETSDPTEARTRIERYDPTAIEPRWQTRWEELGLHETDLFDESRPKSYILTMYPYPSGDLHIGHWYIVTPTDALARFRRMHGYNVFFPIGFDAYGLPAENAAIKNNINPRDWTMQNVEHERKQFRSMGAVFDWRYEIVTCDPGFYRWNQWMFLRFLEAGLAYRRMSPVDWCPNDGTLAREQVEGPTATAGDAARRSRSATSSSGTCERRSTPTSCSISRGIDWPEPIRLQQTNWIGRSEGAELDFEVAPDDHQPGGDRLRVFTTRPDTLFGATFMVLAPEHPLVATLTAPDRRAEVDAYIEQARRRTEIERLSTDREKTGVIIGADAINPVNGERIPIWIADYVLSGYGTGAIMAVPAHDERDFEFAKRFGLEIRRVVAAPGEAADAPMDGAFIAHAADEPGQQRAVQRAAGGRGRQGDRRRAGRDAAGRNPRSPTAFATGCSAASATGGRPSRSSTARPMGSCLSQTKTCPSSFPRRSTTPAAG